MPRPELQAPPEIFYNDTEARKYTTSSRIIGVQNKISERALELLALPDDGVPQLLLDIGFRLPTWSCRWCHQYISCPVRKRERPILFSHAVHPLSPQLFQRVKVKMEKVVQRVMKVMMKKGKQFAFQIETGPGNG